MAKIMLGLEAGYETEGLVNYIFRNLSDDITDQIDLDKIEDNEADLAFEPLIIAGVLTLTTTTAVLVCRLIEKWMEQKAQETRLRIVCDAAQMGLENEVVGMLASLSEKYADVSIAHGVPKSVHTNFRVD